jgi:hypothetical protein
MPFCAICGRDHPTGPCTGNPIDFGPGAEGRQEGRLEPEFEWDVKRTERVLLLIAVAAVAAVVVFVLIS